MHQVHEWHGDRVLDEVVQRLLLLAAAARRREAQPDGADALCDLHDRIVCNANLRRVFRALRLRSVHVHGKGPRKALADAVEALVGVLAQRRAWPPAARRPLAAASTPRSAGVAATAVAASSSASTAPSRSIDDVVSSCFHCYSASMRPAQPAAPPTIVRGWLALDSSEEECSSGGASPEADLSDTAPIADAASEPPAVAPCIAVALDAFPDPLPAEVTAALRHVALGATEPSVWRELARLLWWSRCLAARSPRHFALHRRHGLAVLAGAGGGCVDQCRAAAGDSRAVSAQSYWRAAYCLPRPPVLPTRTAAARRWRRL